MQQLKRIKLKYQTSYYIEENLILQIFIYLEQLNEKIFDTLITDQDLLKTTEVIIIEEKRKVNKRVLEIDSVDTTIKVKVEK
jgi:hypothetical protein